jgi:hypothetical protein
MFPTAARSRLLPMSVPFRHFGAAALFQVPAWLLVVLWPEEFVSFSGGLGPLFAALHLLTLGVLAMAAIGASLQLLPIATRQPVRSIGALKLGWWFYVPGVALFAAGAAIYAPRIMAPGAAMVVAGLAVYFVLLCRNLLGARGMGVVVSYGWAALGCLAALAFTGLALVLRYEHGLALDYPAFRAAHLVLAAYGFMGLLALGLSNFLLPMLALAPAPPPRTAYVVLKIAVVALVLLAVGWTFAASLLGLAAGALHVASLERSLRARLRRPLGFAFVLVRASWACLLASLVAAALLASGAAPQGTALVFGVLLVPGWLLTFLLGVLQRILPFLGSVHASSTARGTPLISALTPPRVLIAHGSLHLAALVLLLGAAASGSVPFAAAAGASGLGAAALYAAFFFFVVFKVRHHGIESPNQPAPA